MSWPRSRLVCSLIKRWYMKQQTGPIQPPIPLKPIHNGSAEQYGYYVKELQGHFSFRSMDLSQDVDMIYDWVNQAYARRFWQLQGTRDRVLSTYAAILENPRAHSFIGCLNEQPICQIDLYGIRGEELEQHTEASPLDCGLHLLMLPSRQLQKGWSYYALKIFQRFYFSYAEHEQLFAEPDQGNIHANRLAMDAGFQYLKTIELSNKTANLYCLHREEYRPV
jgi:acetyl CoA:N6-hydroxylysine acetyl transferase